MGGNEFKDASPSFQNMENKSLKRFRDKFCVIKGSPRQENIIFNKTLSISDAFHKENSTVCSIRRCTLVYCKIILSSKSKKLPENLAIDSVLHGTINVPPKLNQFFQHLICGPDLRKAKTKAKQLGIHSISQDVTFAAASVRKLPSKHLKLGVALISLTGSGKTVEILNRYGLCANYLVVKEIETELTLNATETRMKTPNGMIACSKGGAWCALDHFDRFLESQSGKDTLYDTVEISYELAFPEFNGSSDAEKNDKNTHTKKATGDSETYSTSPSSTPVNSKTRTLEIDLSNKENSASITDYGQAKLASSSWIEQE